MNVLITIVSYLAIMVLLVMVHELGHFLTAKAFSVRVEEFGIGFPPRLWGKQRGETIYSVNAIPLGGFVKLAGEEDPEIEHSLASKPKGVRFLVLSAGAIMNLLLPVLLLTVAFMVPHKIATEPVIVGSIAEGSPAAAAGMLPGDTILTVDNYTVSSTNDVYRYVQLNLGKNTTFTVRHSDGTVAEVTLVPRWNPPEGEGSIGIAYNVTAVYADRVITTVSEPFWRAIPMGINECYEIFILFKNSIVGMFIGATPVILVGPVGVAQLTGEAVRAGFSPLLEFAAIFSICIGIFNLFPLPALDGGRIVFVFLEWVRRGKRVAARTEGLVHLIGFILLLAVVLVVTYQDIGRLISGTGF